MAILTAAQILEIVNRGERVFDNRYTATEKDIDRVSEVPGSDPTIPPALQYFGADANAIGIMGRGIQGGVPANANILRFNSSLDKWEYTVNNLVTTDHAAIGASAGVNTPIHLSTNDRFILSIAETLGNFPTTGNAVYYGERINLTLDSNTAVAGAIIAAGHDNLVTVPATHTSNLNLLTGVKSFINRLTGASGNISGVNGIRGDVFLGGSGTLGYSNIEGGIFGGRFFARVSDTNTCTHLGGIFAQGWSEDTATITNVYGVYAKASNHNTDGPVVTKLTCVAADLDVPRHTTDAIGVHVFATNGTAADISFGLKVDSLAGTQNYGIWVTGNWSNYLGGSLGIGVNPTTLLDVNNAIRADQSSTADDTRFLLYDVTAGTFKRVSRGAVDSGGTGFRVLRIPN